VYVECVLEVAENESDMNIILSYGECKNLSVKIGRREAPVPQNKISVRSSNPINPTILILNFPANRIM